MLKLVKILLAPQAKRGVLPRPDIYVKVASLKKKPCVNWGSSKSGQQDLFLGAFKTALEFKIKISAFQKLGKKPLNFLWNFHTEKFFLV